MAEFLVKAVDATNIDQEKNDKGCFKVGDLIDCRPNGFAWGNEEHPSTTTHDPPRFFILKASGITVVEGQVYMHPWKNAQEEIQRRRRYHIKVAELPQPKKNEIANTGELNMAWDVIATYIWDKKDQVYLG